MKYLFWNRIQESTRDFLTQKFGAMQYVRIAIAILGNAPIQDVTMISGSLLQTINGFPLEMYSKVCPTKLDLVGHTLYTKYGPLF